MPTVNDTLEFELNRASVFLGELAAENIDPGVEPGTWGAFQDRADTFFESVLCPSPANKNFKENYAKWKALMHSKLDMLGAHGSLGKELLSSQAANLWLVMLTPHTLWSVAEKDMCFPHLCYSWGQCKPWMEAVRKLASILGDATEYMHQCAVMLAGKEGAEGSPELSPLKEQNLSTSCQHTMTDILNHSISEAAAAFQGLKRRNSRFVMDVLMFIRSAVEAKIRIASMEPSTHNPPPMHLHNAIRDDSSASKLTDFITSVLEAMIDTTALWMQQPTEAIASVASTAAQSAAPAQTCSHDDMDYIIQGCQRRRINKEMKESVSAPAQVPLEARRRVLCAFLKTIAAFHGARKSGDVLAAVQPCLMGRAVSILQHLGQARLGSPEFLTLCCKTESSNESDSDGDSAVSHDSNSQASSEMKVGAAVAVMLQVAVLQSPQCTPCTARVLETCSATQTGQYGLIAAACTACMCLVAHSQETRSLEGLDSAFWTLGGACTLAARSLEKEQRAAGYHVDAAHSAGPTLAHPDDPGTASGATCDSQQSSLLRVHDAAEEQIFACARAAHSTMVEHTDQSVCMSALKALKAVVAVLGEVACIELLEELLDVDMPQVQAQLIDMLQRRMHRSDEMHHGVWNSKRVGTLAMAGLLRVAEEQEQGSGECTFSFVEQVGFEEPLLAAVNLLRHHVIRRRVRGATNSFSEGFMEAIPRKLSYGTHGQDIAFMSSILSHFHIVSRYAKEHMHSAVRPLIVLIYAAEALLEEMKDRNDET